jgi:asparagine synthase (glutamine-hydrolysing)
MCGIAGIAMVDSERIPEEDGIRRMAAAVRHRGPDGEGVHRGPGIGLAVRRLAIVAPDAGQQPITSESGSTILVCNGEIYNAPELRRVLESRGHRFRTGSDVEVVLHLYEERGLDCLEELRGMFALALWDGAEQRLLLARDRAGMKPLVWTKTATGLAFASEAKALFAAGLVEPKIDSGAIDALFRFGYVVSPRTAFEGIHALLPGHRLLYSGGNLQVQRWWEAPRAERSGRERSPRTWAKGLMDRLEEAVRLHLRSDVPVSTWLSGGLDSSVVTALVARELRGPVDVHTLGFEDPRFDEVAGGTLADHGGPVLQVHRAWVDDRAMEHFPRAMWHAESPTTNLGELPRWILSEATGRSHRVVLAGEGCDEIFGGYPWYGLDRWTRPLARLPRGLRRRMLMGPLSSERRPWVAGAILAPADPPLDRFVALTGPRDAGSRASLYSADLRSEVAGVREAGLVPEDALAGEPSKGSFDRMQYVEMKVRLPDFIELKLDRLSMAHGVEVRLPFLDPEVVSYAAKIPAGLKLRGSTEKWILRVAAEGLVPDTIRWRRKRGLAAPFRRWFGGSLPSFAEELLSASVLDRKGYFDSANVVDRLKQHRAGVADHGNSLSGVLAVQTLDEVLVSASRSFRDAPST